MVIGVRLGRWQIAGYKPEIKNLSAIESEVPTGRRVTPRAVIRYANPEGPQPIAVREIMAEVMATMSKVPSKTSAGHLKPLRRRAAAMGAEGRNAPLSNGGRRA